MSIKIENLSKVFRSPVKQAGLFASIKSLFSTEYKEKVAVDNISFEIEQGEIVGFIGPNGAGKTTTLKMLSGLLYPTSGKIEVLGFDPSQRDYKFLKQISMVMGQKRQLWWDLPAIESFNLNKEIYEIPEEKYRNILGELLELFELKDLVNTQVRRLSLGERMRCEIVASILHQPQVLFLDEPTIGLDVAVQKKVRNLIREFNKLYKSTIMLTSHYMDDVFELCDRLIIINHGKLLFDGKVNEFVSKHIKTKTVSVVFNKELGTGHGKEVGTGHGLSLLRKFGEINILNKFEVDIEVSREKVPMITSQILSEFDVDDIDIKEKRLEDVISGIWT